MDLRERLNDKTNQLDSALKEKEQLRAQKEEDHDKITSLKKENEQVTARLDSFLAVTQKDRVQATVDKLDLSQYIEEIGRLKKSEQQLRLRLKQV